MATSVCGKKEKIFEGFGTSSGRQKNKAVIKLMAENASVQNAYEQAELWIRTIKCRKTCSAKSSNTEYVSISRFEENNLPGGIYRCSVRTKVIAKVDCKDLIRIPVKTWTTR